MATTYCQAVAVQFNFGPRAVLSISYIKFQVTQRTVFVMDVQTLTTDQQKHTLSGKKRAKRKVPARNTLSTPYNPYWPVVNSENEVKLESTLRSWLPLAKRSYDHIPWSELRKLTKEQRRERRKCSRETSNLSESLVLGVNGVSRAMERGALSCALVAGDVQPRILVSHLATLSAVQRLPLLVLSSLRDISQATLGFSCIALGLKKCVADSVEHQLQPLLQLVTELWKKVPQPDVLGGYLDASVDDACPEDSSASEPDPVNSPAHINNLYLRRTSKKERVFVPGDSKPSQPSTGAPAFISLGRENAPSSVDQHQSTAIHFQPLRIKRIQPNPNKNLKRKKGNAVTQI